MSAADEQEHKILVNPSWVIQALILALIAVAGYFIDDKLNMIGQEIQLSRIERSQIRSDMSAMEVGLKGDRFTRRDWELERERLDEEHRRIRTELQDLHDSVQKKHP